MPGSPTHPNLNYPPYPFPLRQFWVLVAAALTGSKRSFRQDATAALRVTGVPVRVFGESYIPIAGPFLLVFNHYARPGFQAWWMALALASVLPLEMHWSMTAAWTFRDRPALRPLTPLTRWAFRRVAQVYGFTRMPAMPPDPTQAQERADAVREVLDYSRSSPAPAVALAPEGMDMPGGMLGTLPPGVGRFIGHLAKYCQRIVPVGVHEKHNCLCLNFGAAFQLEKNSACERHTYDQQVSRTVMTAIASLLPEHLRGEFR